MWSEETCTKLVNLGHVVFEICELACRKTCRHADRIKQYSAPEIEVSVNAINIIILIR